MKRIALIALALLLTACGSTPPQGPQSLRQAERFLRSGVEAYRNSDYAGAGAMFGKAHGLYRSIDHSEGMILSGINLAETAIAMGSFERAERQIAAAGALAKSSNSEARFGPRLAVLAATAAHGLGKRELALERLQPLLPVFDADDAPDRVEGATTLAAVILRTRIAFEAAQGEEAQWTRRLERVAAKSDDPLTRARLLRFQGQLAQRTGDTANARRLLTEALTIYRDRANRPGTAATLNELGQLAIQMQEWSAAKDYLERALYIHTWILNTPGAAESLQQLAAVHAATGEHPKAEAAQRWSTALTKGTPVNWRELRDQVIPTSQ